jgi:hypothetical protein
VAVVAPHEHIRTAVVANGPDGIAVHGVTRRSALVIPAPRRTIPPVDRERAINSIPSADQALLWQGIIKEIRSIPFSYFKAVDAAAWLGTYCASQAAGCLRKAVPPGLLRAWELIVADNASTGDTAAVAAPCAVKLPVAGQDDHADRVGNVSRTSLWGDQAPCRPHCFVRRRVTSHQLSSGTNHPVVWRRRGRERVRVPLGVFAPSASPASGRSRLRACSRSCRDGHPE